MNKLSYSLGVNISAGLRQQGFEINDYESFTQGIKDAFESNIKLDSSEINDLLNAEYQRVQSKSYEEVIAKSKEFLAENLKREGVVELESGLQYEVITQGSGAKPKLSDTVTTHYHGTLPSGKVFDSSVDRGQPASFPVSGVIKGWTEALQLMNIGSKYKLFVPSDLAYGAQGAGNDIGPHQALVFEVELLDIK
ncbi:MAG: FKBP-type peptidyl-prolyl cis-trans isomerase [Bacteroidetes bacterium]|nr:MAG: FKBP-type peptidyl-prolyl cis-trans isomerase [Bacteroidota bacterium]